jgi:hypothetical protein
MRELIELRREYDSTGLRAAPKLIAPLLRCVSLVKHTCISRASETIQQINTRGSRQAPPRAFRSLELAFR